MNNNNNEVDASTAATSNGATPIVHKRGTSGLIGWAKTVEIAFRASEIECCNPEHYAKSKKPADHDKEKGRWYPHPVARTPAQILDLMKPYTDARCACERAACKEAWSWNAPGVLQTSFVCKGTYRKGVGKYDPMFPPKRVMPVAFRMDSKSFDVLHNRFPDWLFVQTANGGHDHPVSHVTTQVVTFEVMAKLKEGSYLDVHGNPTANEQFMARKDTKAKVDTVVTLASAKDYVRMKTKWGPEFAGGKRRWIKTPYIRDFDKHSYDVGKNRQGFLSFHTGYYYAQSEILSILRCSPDATFTMVMHRFDGAEGKLNNGELSWKKVNGNITQENVKTGEKYCHPDNSHWFTSSSWSSGDDTCLLPELYDDCDCYVETECTVDLDGEQVTFIKPQPACHTGNAPCRNRRPNPEYGANNALAWTVNQACEGVYIVTVVCTPHLAHCLDTTPHAQPARDRVQKFRTEGKVELEFAGQSVCVPIASHHAELFDECVASMCNKERTEAKFKAHCATVASKTKGYLRDRNIQVDSEALSDIQVASFWFDFRKDVNRNIGLLSSAQWLAKQHSLSLSGKGLLRLDNAVDMVLELVAMGLRAKNNRDAALAVVGGLQALNKKI